MGSTPWEELLEGDQDEGTGRKVGGGAEAELSNQPLLLQTRKLRVRAQVMCSGSGQAAVTEYVWTPGCLTPPGPPLQRLRCCRGRKRSEWSHQRHLYWAKSSGLEKREVAVL